MKRTVYGKGARGKATALHSKLVRSRGVCENCGERDYSKLTTAHIIRRNYSATRTDEANAFCLCFKCHYRFENFPVEFSEFIDRTIGRARYDALFIKAMAGVGVKFDWDTEVERLKALVNGLEAA